MEYVSTQAESSVLGSILIDGELIEQTNLKPHHFNDMQYSEVFAAMLAVKETGLKIDAVSVSNILGKRLSEIGGYSMLINLAQSVPTVDNFQMYTEIIREKYAMRQIYLKIKVATKNEYESADEMLDYLENVAREVDNERVKPSNMVHIKDAMISHIDDMTTKAEGNAIQALPSKFQDFNKLVGGYRKTELSIVAARPSLGKTAHMINEALHAAMESKAVVLIFSLEMARRLLVDRMISNIARIDGSAVRDGLLDDDEWGKYTIAASEIANTDMYIDDTSANRLSTIKEEVRLKRKEFPDRDIIVMIDYLQLITLDKEKQNRNLEISTISAGLKQVARDNDAHVMALSQLSRGVEQRQDKRPIMSDLRESGAIEQDADLIEFLYRDDYYNADTEKKNIVEVIVAKNRNGAIGTVELVFLKNFNMFVNYERYQNST